MFYFFETVKKYTRGLLDTFNNIYVEKYIDEENKKLVNVPISFASKDAASIFSDLEYDQMTNGNFEILPRMSLSLDAMDKDESRNTSRFHIPIKVVDENNNSVSFQHNSVSYFFLYSLTIASRSLTDLTCILEQILPAFNPNLILPIRELDWLKTPTNIQVELSSVTFDLPDEDDGTNIRICSATIIMNLHGNLYPPITNSELIKTVKFYLSAVDDLYDIDRQIVHKFDTDDTFKMDPSTYIRIDYYKNWNTIKPEILSVIGDPKILINKIFSFKVEYKDDTDDNLRFMINVKEDTGVKPIISKNMNFFQIQAQEIGKLVLNIQAVNSLGLQSNIFVFEIEVVDERKN